ncbi:MLP-like protein 329 [Rutidosis leptorrhynchoides]|uniref:MLP-like protein 329 n=1 Tax=Rutidosis leptorrhynchoides TaxID=125765 RepID=UPI003A997FF8
MGLFLRRAEMEKWTKSGPIPCQNIAVANLQSIYGRAEFFKERFELDDANMIAKHVGVDGDLFKFFKSFVGTFQFMPKGTGTLAKITIQNEKLSYDSPDDIDNLNFLIQCNRDADEHLAAKAEKEGSLS